MVLRVSSFRESAAGWPASERAAEGKTKLSTANMLVLVLAGSPVVNVHTGANRENPYARRAAPRPLERADLIGLDIEDPGDTF